MKFILPDQIFFCQVSFGTIFFPMEPQKLAAFLEIAMKKNIPFVSHRVLCQGIDQRGGLDPQSLIAVHPSSGRSHREAQWLLELYGDKVVSSATGPWASCKIGYNAMNPAG